MSDRETCPTCGRPLSTLRVHLSRKIVRRLTYIRTHGPQETDGKGLDLKLEMWGFVSLAESLTDEPAGFANSDTRVVQCVRTTSATHKGKCWLAGSIPAPKYMVMKGNRLAGKANLRVTVVDVMGVAALEPTAAVGEPAGPVGEPL